MLSRNVLLLFLFFVICSSPLLSQEAMKAYANYDFVPGDTIIFEDDFSSGLDGEFPPMWKIVVGQGVVNKIDGVSTFVLTEGNYAIMMPRIKKIPYLGDVFTVECDFKATPDGSGVMVFLPTNETAEIQGIAVDGFGVASTQYFPDMNDLNGTFPQLERFTPDSWHHLAIAYKDGQLKCYVDEFRVLVVPELTAKPGFVTFGGSSPLYIRNVRIALGGGMNMLDRIYKDGRIVSHGILFDAGKATLKPQSMGVINGIAKLLQKDANLKLSVEGHTDSDGDDASNLKLSESRAQAVKDELVKTGIDAGRLTIKGWGESKPIGPNTTPDGKANNRRVEFVKTN